MRLTKSLLTAGLLRWSNYQCHKDNTVHVVEVHRDVTHKEADLQLDVWQSATWDNMNMSPCSLQYTYSLGPQLQLAEEEGGGGEWAR